jgi:hypothetical protein
MGGAGLLFRQVLRQSRRLTISFSIEYSNNIFIVFESNISVEWLSCQEKSSQNRALKTSGAMASCTIVKIAASPLWPG